MSGQQRQDRTRVTPMRQHTDGADDGRAAVVFGWSHIRMKLGMPFQLHTVAEVVERGRGRHFDGFSSATVEGRSGTDDTKLTGSVRGDEEKRIKELKEAGGAVVETRHQGCWGGQGI